MGAGGGISAFENLDASCLGLHVDREDRLFWVRGAGGIMRRSRWRCAVWVRYKQLGGGAVICRRNYIWTGVNRT